MVLRHLQSNFQLLSEVTFSIFLYCASASSIQDRGYKEKDGGIILLVCENLVSSALGSLFWELSRK